jgi:hypothetical protein
MPLTDQDNIITATQEERSAIVTEAEEALSALGIAESWECLVVGGLMGAKFSMCDKHYRDMLKRISDHVTSEIIKEQLN